MAENKDIEFVKASAGNEYLLIKFDNQYFIVDNTSDEYEMLSTPGGGLLNTAYLSLAERLLEDVQKYGPMCMSSDSLLPWHYTLCENFSKMEHYEVEMMLDECFVQKPDWTYNIDDDEWKALFGSRKKRVEEIIDWLSNCTHMQMTAACCIGNAYNSINIAFVLAWLMENYTGNERNKQLKALAELMADNSFYGPAFDIFRTFNNFNLYYGIHLEEDGVIIDRPFPAFCCEDDDLFDVTEEMLVGRNYDHYIHGVRDTKQSLSLHHDLASYVSDEEDEDEEEDELLAFIPDDCWVKRISVDEDESEAYYILVLQTENGKIRKITALLDIVSRTGGSMFYIPGDVMPGTHSYEEIDIYDYAVLEEEVEALKNGRFMPEDFTFVGKKLPATILENNKHNGDDTLYMICQQSAHRLAYINVFIHTNENGIVKDFDYSTYQSTGSAFGDMFSRPHGLPDLNREAIDVLLYIYDAYTDEELEKL